MALVEVSRKPYLASIVPVIVNAILSEHQIIVDIVAFVNKGDFPRSRLGEKQRGKILAGWVTRKLRTLAQFAIRDVDAAAMNEGGADGIDPSRASMVSVRSGGPLTGASSLRNIEPAPQILEQEEYTQPTVRQSYMPPPNESMSQLPNDHAGPVDYQQYNLGDAITPSATNPTTSLSLSHQTGQDFGMPDFAQFEPGPGPSAPPEPVELPPDTVLPRGQVPPQIRLPGVDGREDVSLWRGPDKNDNEEEDGTVEAIMHMNLAGDMNRR